MREKNAEISARVDEMICLLHTNPNKLANALGYSRAQTIYDILNGKAAPSYDFFKRFLASGYAAFINLRWLISGEGSPIIEETYYQSDLPIVKGEMSAEQAKQKLEEIRSRKNRPQHITENSAMQQPSKDLVSHLEARLNEKDNEIGRLHEDIGRLKERIVQLEREKNDSSASYQTAPKELSKSPLDL
jgi:polyhydroxyalkanoate synthesis regulator phasin|nr:MAG TPA: structural protein [Caudoviricetes sp.]